MIRRDRLIAGLALAAAAVIAIVAVAAGDGGEPVTTTDESFVPPPATARPTPTVRPTPTSIPVPEPETVASFVFRLDAALEAGDLDFAFSRLHPLAVSAAGQNVCRRYIDNDFAAATDIILAGDVVGPNTITKTVGEFTQRIRDHYTAQVTLTFAGEDFVLDAEFASIGGRMYWFSTCE